MRKFGLYAAGICTALALGTSGCASAPKEAPTAPQTQESTAETTEVSTTVVETVSGTIESMAESQPQVMQSICIYGPVTQTEDGRLSIDNQSGVSASGEIILNVDPEKTYLLDGVSGSPVKAENIKTGDTIYVYIGPTMTMSLPPITNAEVIFTNIPADGEAPRYVEVKSMITDAGTSKSVLTAVDGTEYTLTVNCNIFPYLTRNIVTLDDLTEGRKCVVWSDEDGNAHKIMVFAQ